MLAIITTHPIQYQVPLWQALARDGRVPFEIWYLTDHGARITRDKEFGRDFAWDLPLLEGYPHRFLKVNPDWVMDLVQPHRIRLAAPLTPLLRGKKVTHLMITGWHKLAFWQAVRQARRAGVKVWLRGESNDLAPVPRWKRAVRRLVHGWLFRRVDEFLCIGQANRRLYEKAGVSAARLHWAPYGVDNARFAAQAGPARARRAEIRRQWGIAEDAFCVLFCGKLVAKKHPLDIVAAAQRLMDAAPARTPHLLYCGSGELGRELRAATQVVFDRESPSSNPGPENVANFGPPARPKASFLGFMNQTEISQAYVAADCLVLPSDYNETWGLVVNEAMASGLPCAVSDAAGCGEDLVAPLNPRLRFPLGDFAALAAALGELRWHPPSRPALEAQVAKYGLDVTVETIAGLWRKSRTGLST